MIGLELELNSSLNGEFKSPKFQLQLLMLELGSPNVEIDYPLK